MPASTPSRRRAGRPAAGAPQLTREGILRAALRLVDDHGLDALSMRRLAGVLGADPMAIYHHLPNKAAIVSGLVRLVFAEMRLPETGVGTWEDQIRAWVSAYRELAHAHPNLVLQLVTDPAAVSEAMVTVSEPLYAALESAGLPAATVVQASGMLVDYVNGHALAEVSTRAENGDDELSARLAAQDPEHIPAMLRVHAVLDAGAATNPTSDFDASLEIMLGGLRAAGRADAAARRGRRQRQS